jgi:ubiquitin carboxyl-terminal hydrolase 8
MSSPPSKTSLSSLPISSLAELANDFEPLSATLPRQWFEKALYEAEKAVLAQRYNNTEELFVAYVRACKCYTNVKGHPKFVEEKKKDPTWAKRVNDFKEVRLNA